MAILSGTLTKLDELFEPYALTPGGKVYDLSAGLLYQQDGTSTIRGPIFNVAGSISPVNVIVKNPAVAIVGMKFGGANTKITLADSVSNFVNLTNKELTISMWVSGSTYATNVDGLRSAYKLQTSSSSGIQLVIGAVDTLTAGASADYAVATYSQDASGTTIGKNVIASTRKTAGLNSDQLSAAGYGSRFRGRYSEIDRVEGPPTPMSLIGANTWRHIVYVQRAAENPAELFKSRRFDVATSALQSTSRNGKEGLCQVWVDGELRYESPAHGPFPQGFSPYFYEQGLEGYSGSSAKAFPGGTINLNTLRSVQTKTFLSGGNPTGDAVAQLAIWNRCLTSDEIVSIYKGVQEGVYTRPVSSVSSAPKRLIGLNENVSPPTVLNLGFQDSAGSQKLTPFSDTNPNASIIENRTYQQFHRYDLMASGLESSVLSDGTTKKPDSHLSPFRDSNDPTSFIQDDEFLIPSGSAVVRIPIPNNDRFTFAGRYSKRDPALLDTFNKYVGTNNVGLTIGTGFLYYSPQLRRWVEKRADITTSVSSDYSVLSSPGAQASASNFILQKDSVSGMAADIPAGTTAAYANKIMSQFSWSPQFGYYVSHVEHLKQAGYERIGWPTSFFGAPNSPKYHAFDHETIKLSNYINRPFLLKRIEVRVPVQSQRRFGANPKEFVFPDSWTSLSGTSGNNWERQITNKKDMDNYVFFVYRQRRVSKSRDSAEDRNTSKRYLIASASVCYVNSASFGGAWKDGFYDPRPFGWPSTGPRSLLSGNLARPTATQDVSGSSLTLITGTNCVLHSPQYTFEWGVDRFYGASSSTMSVTQSNVSVLELKMQPMVVPCASASPSLIPLECEASSPIDKAYREGGDNGALNLRYCYAFVTSGSRTDPKDTAIAAPTLTLVSNFWPGGRRPPLFGSNQQVDPYDTTQVTPPQGLGYTPGMLDSIVHFLPSLCDTAFSRPSTTFDSVTTWIPLRGPMQGHGVTNFPQRKNPFSVFQPGELLHQMPVDPQSVNGQTALGKIPNGALYGRITNRFANNANSWSVNSKKKYMGEYGWRFISSFILSDLTEQQTYSPEILEPEDELILGLDAGTFGPPDLDVDDLLVPGQTGLEEAAAPGDIRRLYKNTYLKEDYRFTLADSRLQVMPGEAEITLVGDFLEDQSPAIISRDTPGGSSISITLGNELITDRNFLYNSDLLSGSMFTRVFSGAPGPQGVIDGNPATTAGESAARKFYFDAGSRRTL